MNEEDEEFKWDGYQLHVNSTLFEDNNSKSNSTSLNIEEERKKSVYKELKELLLSLRNFQLYWLSKELVLRRDNINMHKLLKEEQKNKIVKTTK